MDAITPELVKLVLRTGTVDLTARELSTGDTFLCRGCRETKPIGEYAGGVKVKIDRETYICSVCVDCVNLTASNPANVKPLLIEPGLEWGPS